MYRNTATGTPNASGYYDGMVGILQRDEADVMATHTAIDDLPFDPVIAGPATDELEAHLITLPRAARHIGLDLLAAFDNFSVISWIFIFFASYMVMTVYWIVAVEEISRKPKMSKRQKRLRRKFEKYFMLRQVYAASWNVLSSVLDQVDYEPHGGSRRVMWTFFTLFLFVAFNIFSGFMSASLVVTENVAKINSLEDLVSEQFHDVVPMWLEQLQLISMFQNANTGSTRWMVWQKATRIGLDKAVFKLDFNAGDIIAKFNDATEMRDVCIIQTSHVSRIIFGMLGCSGKSELDLHHFSNEPSLASFYGYAYSKKTPKALRDYMDVKLKRIIDYGLYDFEARKSLNGLVPPSFANYKCSGQITEPKEESPPDIIQIAHLLRTFKYCAFSLALAGITLTFETLTKNRRRVLEFSKLLFSVMKSRIVDTVQYLKNEVCYISARLATSIRYLFL